MAEPPENELELVFADAPAVDPQAAALHEATTKALKLDQLQEQLDSLRQDRKQRKTYGNRLFVLVSIWLGAIGLVVLLHGFTCVPFKLSTPVLATLIGSTTASVLGLFAIVATYLFPKR